MRKACSVQATTHWVPTCLYFFQFLMLVCKQGFQGYIFIMVSIHLSYCYEPPLWRLPFGCYSLPINQSSPSFPVLPTSDPLAQLQPCPYCNIFFPYLLPASSLSSSSDCSLEHCLGKPVSSCYAAELSQCSLHLLIVVRRSS